MATEGLNTDKYLQYLTPDNNNSTISNVESSPNNNNNNLNTNKYLKYMGITQDSNIQLPDTSYVPSEIEKLQYGAAQETYLLGDIFRITESAIKAIGPTTFGQEREKAEKERMEELYKKFPWARTGQYDNDASVWGGRAAVMISDPLYLLMPWARAAQMGKLVGKGGLALGGLGAGVGVADATLRGLARDGEVSGKQVGFSAIAGGVLSPAALGVQKVGGAALNKLFPNLFKNKTKIQQEEITNTLRNEFKNKYNLNDKQLDDVSKISSLPKVQQLFDDVVKSDNNYKTLVKPLQDFVEEIKNAKSITALLNKKNALFSTIAYNQKQLVAKGKDAFTKPYDFKFKVGDTVKSFKATKVSDFKNYQDDIIKGLLAEQKRIIKLQARKEHLYQVEVIKQIHKAGGLPSAIGRALSINLTRPIVGAGAGAVTGTLFTDSEEGFDNMVRLGFGLGLTHRLLMRGGITNIPKPVQISFANMLKSDMWENITRKIRIGTSQTQQSRLGARGTILDELSVMLFSRPTDTVRLDWLGRVAKNQDKAIGIVGTGNAVEEVAERRFHQFVGSIYDDVIKGASVSAQDDAIKIVRGSQEKYSDEAIELSKRIKEWLGNFKTYYNDVGLTEAQILDNYFPRKFNFKKIMESEESKEEFITTVATVFTRLASKASKANPVEVKIGGNVKKINKPTTLSTTDARASAQNYFENVTNTNQKAIMAKGINSENWNAKIDSDRPVTMGRLPLSEHIEYERALQGSWDDVESLLHNYLVNDVGAVLTDLARTSVKSVEFARVFGPQGQILRGFLQRLDDQYAESGFKKVGGFYGSEHKLDVEAITNAVNSYFGRFGKSGGPVSKSIGATLSTLANFNMMDKVTLANIGDLIQPFQNSRYFSSAIQGFGFYRSPGFSKAMNQMHTKIALQANRDAYTTPLGSSRFAITGADDGSVLGLLNKGNEKFFKLIGLEGITNVSRRYAYNVGIIDAHKTIKRLVTRLDKAGKTDLNDLTGLDRTSLADINHLRKTGTLRINNEGKITNADDVFLLGRIKDLEDAVADKSAANILDRIGMKAANRDALIPQVGNRLLFTQNKNPFIRMLGQFSSWAMAKSAQTNAMVQRVESGELRTAIGLLGSLAIFGGVQDLREFAKTGEFNTYEQIDDDFSKWASDAFIMSGNMGWLPSTVINQVVGYGNDVPIAVGPGYNLALDISVAAKDTVEGFFDKKSYDDAIRKWYKVAPIPTIRGILERVGVPGMTYKKDFNNFINTDKVYKFNQGGFADAFRVARANKQELFTWQGNEYTTKKADENDQQYKNFLLKDKLDNKPILKEEPLEPASKVDLKETLAGHTMVDKNIIIPKKKPILKVEKPNKSKFSLFPSAEAAIPDDKQEIEVNAKKFLEKDISIKDAVETEKFGFQKVINLIPPNVRLVVNDVFTQSTGGKFDKVFTEKNLNKDYKSILKSIALDVLSQGKTNIEYADYKSVDGDNAYADVSYTKKGIPDVTDKRFNLKTALGQAQIKIDGDGNLIIVDRFNFNDSEDINSFTDFYQMVKEIGGSALQGEGYNLVRKVAKWFGSPEGEGQTVRINLGKVDLSNFENVKIAKANKGGVIRKHFRYGGDTMGGPNDKSNAGQGSGSQGPAGGQSSGGNYGGGNNNNNNNNNNDGSTARERYRATQYNKTKTKTKGATNGGSGSDNNNNNNNNIKNSSTNNKNKRKTNALEKVFDVLGSGNTSILDKTKSTDIYNDDSWEGLDLDIRRNSGSLQSTQPVSIQVNPLYGYEIDNPISVEAIANKNVGARVVGGASFIGPSYKGKAYVKGATDLQNFGDIDKSFNVDFSNQSGLNIAASYDLNNSLLKGNVSKYTDIGNTGYSVGVGVDYNDGNIGPSFQIRKDFKKGGLLDKKRG